MLFALSVLGVLAYSLAPLFIYGVHTPDLDDLRNHARDLGEFPKLLRYYGIIPGLISLPIYYALTPLISYLLLTLALKRHGVIVAALAWASLWLVGKPMLTDMGGGAFVGVIGLHLMLALFQFGPGLKSWQLAAALVGLLVFHTFAGMMAFFAFAAYFAIRERGRFWILAPAGAVAVIAGAWWGASSHLILQFGTERWGTAMPVDDALLLYVDLNGLWLFWIGATVGIIAWMRGLRPSLSPFMLMSLALLAALGVMTFTPLQIDPDRTGKTAAVIALVLNAVVIGDSLRFLASKAQTAFWGVALAMVIAVYGSQVFGVWLWFYS